MNKRLFAGIAISLTLGVFVATVKAEADAINAPAQGLAAHEASIIEVFADGTEVIQTKKGVVLKFLPNGLVIKKNGKASGPAVNAGCLSALVGLSKK